MISIQRSAVPQLAAVSARICVKPVREAGLLSRPQVLASDYMKTLVLLTTDIPRCQSLIRHLGMQMNCCCACCPQTAESCGGEKGLGTSFGNRAIKGGGHLCPTVGCFMRTGSPVHNQYYSHSPQESKFSR